MNVQTQDQITFSLGNISYVDYSYDEPPAIAETTPKHSFAHWLGRVVAAIAEWRRRQVVMQEMAMMTDRELADVGLTRSDLSRVFEPAFAADHARRGDYIAY